MFGTAVTTTPGSLLANTADMIRYVNAMDWQRFDTSPSHADFVVSGDLFKLPAGKVGIASAASIGATPGPRISRLFKLGPERPAGGILGQDVTQCSNAIFAEVNVPLVQNDSFGALDLTGAIRYENTGGPGLETTDPKIGLLYATPGGLLALRATWSTSFLAPSLYQRFRENVFFANGIDDPLTPANDNLRPPHHALQGNPDLDPQNLRRTTTSASR